MMNYSNLISSRMLLVLPLAMLFVVSGLQPDGSSLTLTSIHALASGSGGGGGGGAGGDGGADGDAEFSSSAKTKKPKPPRFSRSKVNTISLGKLDRLIANAERDLARVEARHDDLVASLVLVLGSGKPGNAVFTKIIAKTTTALAKTKQQIAAMQAIIKSAHVAKIKIRLRR